MRRVAPASPRGAIGGLHVKARASRTCQTSALRVTSAAVVTAIFGPRSTRGTASCFKKMEMPKWSGVFELCTVIDM